MHFFFFFFLVENYEKGEVKETEQDWSSLGLDFHSSVVHMRVSGGSKIRNLMGYAMKKMKVSCAQTLWVLRPEDSVRTGLIPWLLMSWLLMSSRVISSHGIDYMA